MSNNKYSHDFSTLAASPQTKPESPPPGGPAHPLNTELPDFGNHILRLVSDIQCEDIRREREMRSSLRQQLVIPVTIRFLNGLSDIEAVSRNLSFGGVGLLTNQPIPELSTCLLLLFREDRPPSEVIGECRWCRPFGETYWISGWQFLRMPIPEEEVGRD